MAAAEAYLRGLERRIDAGLNPNVGSVASVFVSRWDGAVQAKVPDIVAKSARHRRRKADIRVHTGNSLRLPDPCGIYNAGARPQRLLWASTGTKDPSASDTLYIESLATPFTVNTMPEATLKALADHGNVPGELLAVESDFKQTFEEFRKSRH